MVIATSFASAQTLSRKVQPGSGGYYNNGANSLSWTIGEPVTSTLSSANNKLSQGFQQPEVDLKAGTISTNPVCVGLSLAIPYTATGIIGTNNVFTAQLSDAIGSFANAVTIGSVTGNTSGVINAIIPSTTIPGNGYRIRILASLPSLTSVGLTVLTTQV